MAVYNRHGVCCNSCKQSSYCHSHWKKQDSVCSSIGGTSRSSIAQGTVSVRMISVVGVNQCVNDFT